MVTLRNSHSRRTLALIAVVSAGLLASLGAVAVRQWRTSRLLKTTFRIGFYNSGKEHFPGADGKAVGNAVDLLNEAARRSGIKLEWVYSPEGTDSALESGRVDLWPLLADLPERKGHVYVSDPWTMTEYGIVSRDSDPVVRSRQSPDVTIASSIGTVEDKLTRRTFPNAKFLAVPDTPDQFSAVCTGKAQVAIVTQNFNQFAMPEDCRNIPLQIIDPPDLTTRFGIGASYRRPGAVQAANVLRDALDTMATDGTMVGTEFRWHEPSLPPTPAVFYVLAAERRQRLLAAAIILLGVIVVLLGWLIFKRKHAEEALSEERRLLRTLIDNMPDYIYVKDAASRYVVANRAIAELMGASNPDKLLGKTDFDFFPKDLATPYSADEKAILQSGEPRLNQEERTVDAQGIGKWTSTSKVPWRSKVGQVIGIMGIGHDITRLKTAQEAIRESNQALTALVEASPAAIVCCGYDGNVTMWNPAAEQTFGWNEAEVLGRPMPVVPEHMRPAHAELRGAVLRGQSIWNQEVVALRKDGSTFDAIVSMAPLRDADGALRGTMDIALDISRRKGAEAQLRLQAAALESAANSVVISDKSGHILWANPAFTALNGYSVDEAVGQTFSIFNSGKHSREFFEQMWKTILNGRVWHGEIVNRRKDGSLCTVDQTITPVRTETGETLHFVVIQQDVTETKALASQLNQAQKMESVGRLAGGVAHDFNNLLSVIIGYSDVLLGNLGLDARAHRQIEEVKKAGDRAAVLTRRLLAFSRQQVLEPKILNLNSIIVETEKMLRRLIGEDIEFQTKLAPDVGSVKVDPGQIEQILMNLAVNSRDAMPLGGKLTIETAEVELDAEVACLHIPCVPGRYVLMTVSDTGVGMDQDTKAHIFEPFFTTKDVGKGTGLGLATVYGIVKQSGGYVWVRSELGQGTAFEVYLPRVDQPARQAPVGDLAPETFNGSEVILVVEDEESVRALICSILSQNGFTVLEAANAASALKIAQQQQPIHLVLTDVVMPGMNGPEMAKRLQEIRPDLKVLFMSGYAGGFGAAHGLLEDGAPLLQKPFTKNMLLRKLRETLEPQSELEHA
jgi:two-component system, cell cycle sensor histidine kinase and response regulator CckA